ncbi:alpha/beta family hydrolase [Litorilituus lipolyticus]|uniref:KANL3/Tex30 alpha/beta hydrolase-like domain-containing protein n=1 Tax=Litorilituus lipolyticus TaxID=2491017 RepID=A0A502KLP4_9GAMM|nr:alpha/beta family hydrolase [Litorilituus lipolyticus]TPH12540.1 hypothetical protein EPA86_16495 [Litorilituus lipolyticus]
MKNTIENQVEKPIAHVIFAHGAGAGMHHEFMEAMVKALNKECISVLRFNFPYMDKRAELGKKYPPDRMPKLLSCYEEVIESYLKNIDDAYQQIPFLVGGKSMGSRVAATLVSSLSEVSQSTLSAIDGVFCLGYPFHPAKKPEKLRLEPLQENVRPVLILQGSRDTLGSEEEIKQYQLSATVRCHFLIDGDHSLKPRVKSGYKLDEHLRTAAKEIAQFATSFA